MSSAADNTSRLLELKKQLKTWEAGFQVEHNRKPSKEDIQQASQVIKDAYADYTRLKKVKPDQEKSAENDVWGKHLNRTSSTKHNRESNSPDGKADDGYSITHFSEKLKLNSSKYSKKLPMSLKSRSKQEIAQVKGNENASTNSGKFPSSPEDEELNHFGSPAFFGHKSQTPKFKISSSIQQTPKTKHANRPLCGIAQRSQYRKSSVSTDWLERCQPDIHRNVGKFSKSAVEPELEPFESEPGDEMPTKFQPQNAVLHREDMQYAVKDSKLETPTKTETCKSESGSKLIGTHESCDELSKVQRNDVVSHGNNKIKIDDKRNSKNDDTDKSFVKGCGDMNTGASSDIRKVSKSTAKKRKIDSGVDRIETASKQKGSKKRRVDSTEIETTGDNTPDEYTFSEAGGNAERESGEECVQDESAAGNKRKKTHARSRKKKQENPEGDAETGDKEDDKEANTPRNLCDDEDDFDAIQRRKKSAYGARLKAAASTKKSATSSKSLDENFVRLNMKRKRYQRKGAVMTGGKYKRMQWKQKMANGDQGGCFKCGEIGHWAKNCHSSKRRNIDWGGGDVKKSKDEEEGDDNETQDVCPFPTLAEAAMMASGVRRPWGGDKGSNCESQGTKNENTHENTETGSSNAKNDGTDAEINMAFIPPMYIPPEPPSPMQPLFEPGKDGQPIATPSDVHDALHKMGYSSFRPGQENAIMRILSGLSTLVVLSTGAGKSLCYQLPAYMYSQRSNAITLVISPLVSLMEDQVLGLPGCLKGARLHSNMTKTQREKVIKEISNGKIQVLLVSPEALVGGGWGKTGCLPSMSQLPPIAFACIDEVHCVSEWSHHFRPSYLRLCKVLRDRLGVRCFLGLTATATLSTATSVAEHLGITDYSHAVVRGAAVPSNLHLSVSRDADRDRAVVSLLKGDRFCHLDSIIVYCTRREQTERLASLLRTCLPDKPLALSEDSENPSQEKYMTTKGKGKNKSKTARKPVVSNSVESYHAGMSAAQRRRIQNQFMSGQLRIVVATVAFGMGLDKSDVRAIIHFNLPKSFENYVQEIGRAGRDGKPAHCHLFLDPEGRDLREIRRHTYGNTVDRNVIKKLVRKCFPKCKCRQLYELQQQNHHKDNDPANTEEEEFPDDGIDYSQITEEEMLQGADCSQGTNNPGGSETGSNTVTADTSIADTDGSRSTGGFVKQQRICPGHEVAMCIDDTVENLDMKEEGIETLLCYLELHSKNWIENMQPTTSTCTINCYGGPKQLRSIAKKCPPLAVAIAKDRLKGVSHDSDARIEFPVIEIASSMGWESLPVKRELCQLQWVNELTPGKAVGSKSGVMVEFSDLSFHFRAPGDLTDSELDEVSDFLTDRVKGQEKAELHQQECVYKSLHSVSFSEYWHCCEEVDTESSETLKSLLSKYFERQPKAGRLAFQQEFSDDDGFSNIKMEECIPDTDALRRDIRSFVCLHHDRNFTGRAIARIFHGIESPCYPARVWGRDRRYWRAHLDADFNSVIKIANEVLLAMR